MNRIAWLSSLVVAVSSPLAAEHGPDGGERVHRSAEGYSKDAAGRGAATTSELEEQHTQPAEIYSKPRHIGSKTTLGDIWIYDGDAVLYDDFDDDGYYRFLSVRFDADTYLADAWVYAMLYLSADGEIWEHYYTTEDFPISGTVPDDEYFVETELVAGYPPGLYDVLIEIYDADFGTFQDDFGPNESSALSLLPVEDASFDAAPITVAISDGHGGGGSMPILLLPWLVAVHFVRKARHRPRDRG